MCIDLRQYYTVFTVFTEYARCCFCILQSNGGFLVFVSLTNSFANTETVIEKEGFHFISIYEFSFTDVMVFAYDLKTTTSISTRFNCHSWKSYALTLIYRNSFNSYFIYLYIAIWRWERWEQNLHRHFSKHLQDSILFFYLTD